MFNNPICVNSVVMSKLRKYNCDCSSFATIYCSEISMHESVETKLNINLDASNKHYEQKTFITLSVHRNFDHTLVKIAILLAYLFSCNSAKLNIVKITRRLIFKCISLMGILVKYSLRVLIKRFRNVCNFLI